MTLCTLQFLHADYFTVGMGRSAGSSHYNFLMSDHIILEPTALEKLLLSISSRDQVYALRLQGYNATSLELEGAKTDASLAQQSIPQHTSKKYPSINPIPLFYLSSKFRIQYHSENLSNRSLWNPLIRIVNQSRMLRDPLYTTVDIHEIEQFPILSFAKLALSALPQNLYDEMAYYKNTARLERNEMFESPSGKSLQWSMPSMPSNKSRQERSILIVVPTLKVNDLSRLSIHIADHAATMGLGTSLVCTDPSWAEDISMELTTKSEMLLQAYAVTSDVFDLPLLGKFNHWSHLFKHILITRSPEYVLIIKSDWAVARLSIIRAILPNSVLAYLETSSEEPSLEAQDKVDVLFSTHQHTPNYMRQRNEKFKKYVHVCKKGLLKSVHYSEKSRPDRRKNERESLGISSESRVVMFEGDPTSENGFFTLWNVIEHASNDPYLSSRVRFLIVTDKNQLQELRKDFPRSSEGRELAFVVDYAKTGEMLNRYLAAADMFFSLSSHGDPSLTLFEAMKYGLLVVATHTDAHEKIISFQSGVLLPKTLNDSVLENHLTLTIWQMVRKRNVFSFLARHGQKQVLNLFPANEFQKCILQGLSQQWVTRENSHSASKYGNGTDVLRSSSNNKDMDEVDRISELQVMRNAKRSIEGLVTVVIKTYICHHDTRENAEILIRSIRSRYPLVKILLGNDGPLFFRSEFVQNDLYTVEIRLPVASGVAYGRNALANYSTTEYLLTMDDDQAFDVTTDLWPVLNGIRHFGFDIVGMRIRNLPGIGEHEKEGIVIPRYVSMIQLLPGGNLSVCVWNENRGPGVYGLRHPISVDVIHQTFIATVEVLRRSPWRNELEVNDHMAFFFDAKEAGAKVGYLPSVFINHLPRRPKRCYKEKRYRSSEFRGYLPFKEYNEPNRYTWNFDCSWKFPQVVQKHIEKYGNINELR